MRTKHNKLTLSTVLYIFILIPFLHPKGLGEVFNAYSIFFKTWTYLAALAVLFMLSCISYSQNHFPIIKQHDESIGLIAYHISLLLVTILTQHKISEGIQKIFVYPIICLFFYMLFDRFKEKAYGLICNYLIILFTINVTVLNPHIFFQLFMKKHISFLGHIQVTAQFCIIALLVAYLDLKHSVYKRRGYLLICLTIISLLTSDALTGYVTLAIFIMGVVVNKRNKIKRIISAKPIKYFVVLGIISFILLYSSIYLKLFQQTSIDLTFSGRVFIWIEAWQLIKQRLWFGYGAYGVLIQPFWSRYSNSNGMNYAHNEVLQLLIDGGLFLFLIFIVLLTMYMIRISKIYDKNIKYWISLLLLNFLLIGMFESITENVYFFIFLVIIGNEVTVQKDNYVGMVLTQLFNDY